MRTLLGSLAVLVAVVGGGPALADAPCVADAARLCPGIPAEDGRLWGCLLQNEFQLSSACQQNLREVQRRAADFNADCAGDVYRFCPRTQAGAGRVLDCLRVHVGRSELATNCEESVVTALERLQEFSDACANDAAALCPGVKAGKGRLLLCLRSQSDHLSSRCRRAVSP